MSAKHGTIVQPRRRRRIRRGLTGLAVGAALAGSIVMLRSDFIGGTTPASFSLCEEAVDGGGLARPECAASDIRFEIDPAGPVDPADSDFGFAVAAGNLNGDDFIDFVVGDPKRNRVYIFFGRVSTADAYGLDPLDLMDRHVSADTRADIILLPDPAVPNQVGSFGYSVAIGREPGAAGCPPNDAAAPLLIGAPGAPGTAPNAPGTAFYLPPGSLCFAVVDPAASMTIDPETLGQSFVSPDAMQDDEFGYSVGFGRVLTDTGTGEDVIVGARAALSGAGNVVLFPVNGGTVDTAPSGLVRIRSLPGDGLGEVIASGDLDLDFDAVTEPFGGSDDLAIGAVGASSGKVILARGPLSPTASGGSDGIYEEGVDPEIRTITGEAENDFFGFSVAIGDLGHLAVGAIYADNVVGGNVFTNVSTGDRINGGKAYFWDPDVIGAIPSSAEAFSADLVLVGRRSGDHLGFAVAFGDPDNDGATDLVVTARREDGAALKVNEIDQGTAYVVYDFENHDPRLASPLDLNSCAVNSDCTGVGDIDVMIFGGDRNNDRGDEIGFTAAFVDFNGDASTELLLSSLTQKRVYLVDLEDSDLDRATEGRNVRDDDDDNDGDSDGIDCGPLDDTFNSGADEIPCDGIDQNCNGLDDDAPDADGDGFDACGASGPADCDDDDPLSFPGAAELCDGNDNACGGAVPDSESDSDGDGFVECTGWNDVQSDDPGIAGGDDCNDNALNTFPGAAPNEMNPGACREDRDGDDWGDATPLSGVTPGTDCEDDSFDAASIFPGAAEIENPAACMKDVDDDGWGDVAVIAPVAPGTDCDDDDDVSFPGAPELCDGNDNACAGLISADEVDPDNDGYVECSGWDDVQGDDPGIDGGDDCDNTDADTFPGAAPSESAPTACMKDSDEDDFGDLSPPAGVTAGTDCDDDSVYAGATFPGAAEIEAPLNCMKDLDDDGFGDDSVTLPIVAGTDCQDDNSAIFTGATEIPNDGIDQNCNGTDTVTCFTDNDDDGFGTAPSFLDGDGDCTGSGQSAVDTDCDDTDLTRFPGATETPDDGIDQDCNGADQITCIVDADQDGAGTSAATTVLAGDGSCDAVDGESTTSDDCDDDDANSFPGASEVCDGNDNDCDTLLPADEGDIDGDGYVACSGWNDTQGDDAAIDGGGDCDETDVDTFPGAAENEPFPTSCRRDKDGDGYGAISPPPGVAAGTDCDDTSADAAVTFPGAAEIEAPLNCMKDFDDDGYGDTGVVLPIVKGSDCDDLDPVSFPGATELCDGNDNACADTIPADELDGDGDGYVGCSDTPDPWNDVQGDDPGITGGNDCDDADTGTFPGAAPNEPVPTACMKDQDGDDWGDLIPPAGVTPGMDCDDGSAVTFPGAAEIEAPLNCMKDEDDDGYGDSGASIPIVAGSDCNDSDGAVNPAVFEGPDGDPVCTDGLDNDCDNAIDSADSGCQPPVPCPDADTDSFADCTTDPTCDPTGLTCGDCDDGNPDINPGETEACDGFDNDCNTLVDDGFDADGDGFTTCQLPVADCDDGNPNVNPGEIEVCNDTLDNDCDPATPDLGDADSDGAACDVDCDDFNPALNLLDTDSDGFATCDGDCNDDNPGVNPGESEVCNDGIDNDCNPATLDFGDNDGDGANCDVDCDDSDPALNLLDSDTDTFTTCQGDCNDADAAINPAALEVCDDLDNDCDGTVDNGFDSDGDLFTTCGGDCDDGDPAINPGATEVCDDGRDNDCDPGTLDLFDADGDGATCDTDCDETDPTTFPGATEQCDGNDNDCDTVIPADEFDVDGDLFVACTGWNDTQGDNPGTPGGDDCDETDVNTFPGAAPNEPTPMACRRDADGDDWGAQSPPPGVTGGSDCDDDDADTFFGAAEIEAPFNCMKDSDDDGYGDEFVTLPVVDGSDCNDADAGINIAATDIPDDGIDQDCSGFDTITCIEDLDQDGFGTALGTTTPAPDGSCDTADQESTSADDCDDTDPDEFPGQSWYADCDGDLAFRAAAVIACDVAGADLATPCADAQPPDGGWTNTDPGGSADSDDENPAAQSGPPPSQVLDVTVRRAEVEWTLDGGAGPSNVYRGDLDTLRTERIYTQNPGSNGAAAKFCGVAGTIMQDGFMPEPGKVVFYLVTTSSAGGESGLGTDSNGAVRPNTNPCP